MVLKIVLKGSLNQVLNLLRTSQIMVHLPLNNITFAANGLEFYSSLGTIAAFDVLPTDDIFDSIFSDAELDPLPNSNFENLGYETTHFMRNLGTPFVLFLYFLLVVPFLVLMLFICKLDGKPKVKNYLIDMKNNLIWNGLIMFFMESYILFVMCSAISLQAINPSTTLRKY